jgi:hypothetical protein
MKILALTAIAFGLHALVAPMQAQAQNAVDMFIKMGGVDDEKYAFTKIDKDFQAAGRACIADKGTPVEAAGVKYCRKDKPVAPASASPATPRR